MPKQKILLKRVQTVNPFAEKSNRESALLRRSLRSREDRNLETSLLTQGAEEHRRTQGWRRSRQVAMPGKASGDARLPSAGSDLKASLLRQASQASPGQSLLRKGKFRFAGKRAAARWKESLCA